MFRGCKELEALDLSNLLCGILTFWLTFTPDTKGLFADLFRLFLKSLFFGLLFL